MNKQGKIEISAYIKAVLFYVHHKNEQTDIYDGSSTVSYMTVCRLKHLKLVYPTVKMQIENVTQAHLLPKRMCLLLRHL